MYINTGSVLSEIGSEFQGEGVQELLLEHVDGLQESVIEGSRSFIFPVVMFILDWVYVFIRETIQRVDFVTHML
jgi:hypothetical protein